MSDRPLHAWPLWTHALLVALFSLGVLLTVGYGFAAEDGSNYIPLAWAQLQPGLFARDEVFQLIAGSSWNHHTSFFTSLMVWLGRLLSLEGAYFVVHFASLWGLLWAIWLIGSAVGGPATGYLGLLSLVVLREVGGTRSFSLPGELIPRSAASSLAFLAIAALVTGARHRLAAGLASVATLIHPISALMALPLVALAPLTEDSPWKARLKTMGLTMAILVVPYLAWHSLASTGPVAEIGLFSTVSGAWQQLIDFRLQGQAVNVGSWSPGQWLLVGVPLLLWAVALGARAAWSRADRLLFVAVTSTTTLAGIGSVAADVFRSSLFTQMMLSRLTYLPLVVGTVYGAWWLSRRFEAGGWLLRLWVLVAFAGLAQGGMALVLVALLPIALLGLALRDPWSHTAARVLAGLWLALGCAVALAPRMAMPADAARPHWLIFGQPPLINVWLLAALGAACLAAASVLRRRAALAVVVALAPVLVFAATHRHLAPAHVAQALAAKVQAPWHPANTPWRELTYWARSETPPGSRFLVPLHQPGFRALAQRPIVTDWKDGGLTLYSFDRGAHWAALYEELAGYERLPEPEVVALARKYGCRYVIMPADRRLSARLAHAAGGFAVYDMAAEETAHAP